MALITLFSERKRSVSARLRERNNSRIRITPPIIIIEIRTPSHSSIIRHVKEGVPLKNSKNWIINLTAMNANVRESKIHDSLYFVSFINLKATTAAMICRTIEIISAISRTIGIEFILQKYENIYL